MNQIVRKSIHTESAVNMTRHKANDIITKWPQRKIESYNMKIISFLIKSVLSITIQKDILIHVLILWFAYSYENKCVPFININAQWMDILWAPVLAKDVQFVGWVNNCLFGKDVVWKIMGLGSKNVVIWMIKLQVRSPDPFRPTLLAIPLQFIHLVIQST